MTSSKRGRGRPKSESTLERGRMETMLKNKPSHIRTTAKQIKEIEKQLAAGESVRKQMLKKHGSPPMPEQIVYAIESADPEFMTDAEIIATQNDYNRISKNIHRGQVTGARTLAEKSRQRKEFIFQKNSILIQRLGTPGWTANRIANKLHEEWDSVKPQQRLTGEATSLDRYRNPSQR